MDSEQQRSNSKAENDHFKWLTKTIFRRVSLLNANLNPNPCHYKMNVIEADTTGQFYSRSLNIAMIININVRIQQPVVGEGKKGVTKVDRRGSERSLRARCTSNSKNCPPTSLSLLWETSHARYDVTILSCDQCPVTKNWTKKCRRFHAQQRWLAHHSEPRNRPGHSILSLMSSGGNSEL